MNKKKKNFLRKHEGLLLVNEFHSEKHIILVWRSQEC